MVQEFIINKYMHLGFRYRCIREKTTGFICIVT